MLRRIRWCGQSPLTWPVTVARPVSIPSRICARYLVWCRERGVEPLKANRAQIELYVRWMQEVRRFQPSTVSRRVSVVAGFYRTCVIDQVLTASPADYVRRPNVPPESPTLGLSHLQFEALLTAARISTTPTTSPGDHAGAARLADLRSVRRQHRRPGRGTRPPRPEGAGQGRQGRPHSTPPAVQRAVERAVAGRTDGPILRNLRAVRMDRHAATRRLKHLAEEAGVRLPRMHPHMLRHTFVTTMLDAGVDLRDVQIAARHADPRTTMRYDRARKNLDRHPTTSSPPTWPPAPDSARRHRMGRPTKCDGAQRPG